MKRVISARILVPFAIVALFIISLQGFTQTYDRDYIDGQVYFKFKDNVQVDIPVNPDRTVDLQNAPFLQTLMQQYEITGMLRPFDINNDFKLLRTFELHFSQFDQVEEIMEELSKNPDFEYVERVPLALY